MPKEYVMPKAVYVIGGSGTGKSTFVEEALGAEAEFSPQYQVALGYDSAQRKAPLVGHRVRTSRGEVTYLGVHRDQYPGLDGVSRLAYLGFNAWAVAGLDKAVIAEGRVLLNKRTLSLFNTAADLLVVHLVPAPEVQAAWLEARGYAPEPAKVREATTRAANMARYVEEEEGGDVLRLDTADSDERTAAILAVRSHLWEGQ